MSTRVHQARPEVGRLYHQRFYVGDVDAIAAQTHQLYVDLEGPGFKPTNANFRVEGVGVMGLPQDNCEPPYRDLWLVGLLMGSPVNGIIVKTDNGTPLDHLRFDGSVSIPLAAGRVLRLDMETAAGAARDDFLFELVLAEM